MSADNWGVCPRCNISGLVKNSEPRSLREDWDLGMSENGEFYILYECECVHCGWKFKYGPVRHKAL